MSDIRQTENILKSNLQKWLGLIRQQFDQQQLLRHNMHINAQKKQNVNIVHRFYL